MAKIEALNRLKWVDALRGYAIFFVLVYHVYQAVPALNLRIQKILEFGSIGVQLFFMVSAFTIFLTLNTAKRKGSHSYLAFFIRRVFRILPLYYLTLLINAFLLTRHSVRFPTAEFFSTLTFTSAWIPSLCPTLVPGGWSIAVEMWFYLVAPLLVFFIKNLRTACYFALGALTFRFVINEGMSTFVASDSKLYPSFLFFWLPNQAPLFALGIVVFFLYKRWGHHNEASVDPSPTHTSGTYAWYFLWCGGYLLTATTIGFKTLLPYHFLFGLSFLLIIQFMILKPENFLANRPFIGLGKISYSAYITHFFVIRFSETWFMPILGNVTQSPELQLLAFLFWTIALTVGASLLLYWAIERPGQAMGKTLIRTFSKG